MKKSCPKCGSSMVLLLTSWACDICQPPGGAVPISSNDGSPQFDPASHMRLWIYTDRSVFLKNRSVFPRKTKEEAKAALSQAALSPYDLTPDHVFLEVWLNFPANDLHRYDGMCGARPCKDRATAMAYGLSYNACWLVEG